MSNKIFMIVGCSGAGKSTQVNSLLSSGLDLTRGIICTTRAPRAGEMNTIDYIFTSVDGLKLDQSKNDVFECRSFNLVTGQAYYYSRRSDFAKLPECNYILAGTLQMVKSYREEFGDALVPIYLDVSDDVAAQRAFARNRDPVAETSRRQKFVNADYSLEAAVTAGIPESNIIDGNKPKHCVYLQLYKMIAKYINVSVI